MMSNQSEIDSLPPDERQRMRSQLREQAVKLAVNSRWSEAAQANREYLRLFGDESEALNRLGKALTELGQITDARAAYGRAIELEPTNTIARRNLDRLATMKDTAVAAAPPTQLDTRLFVEETARAAVAKLQATDAKVASLLDAGDLVDLQVHGNAVNVVTGNGEYVGMVEPRIGLRLARMMTGGNRYAAAMVSASEDDLKVMIRETFQHPSMVGKVSFPQARSDVRAYMPKGLRRRAMEDLDMGSDEDEDVEVEETWADNGEGIEETGPGITIETEDESFD
jgi:hypothetical protein